MKPTLFIIILLFTGLLNELNAQWTIKNLDENSYSYSNVIKFKNDSLGFLMGDHSIILKTVDAGETWVPGELDTKINIKDFQFLGDSTIYAVGDYYIGSGENLTSKLIKSQDNGETWDSLISFAGKQLYSLYFFNKDSGLLAGYDEIYRTVDSGDTWDTVWSITQFGYQFGALKQLTFPTSQIGYAIGIGLNQHNNLYFDNFLLKSIDAGLTWDTIKTFQNPLTTIYFMNQDTGFIGTESSSSIILKTTDGGNTWNETQGATYFNSVNSILFTSNMTGFAAGAPSDIILEGQTSFFISKTINGGVTWESYDTIGIPLNSIYFINDTIGFVSGSYDLIMKSSGKINRLPEDYPWHLVGAPNSIDEDKHSYSRIKIFPNPTDGYLFVQNLNLNKEIKSISLINTSGQTIYIRNPDSNHELIQLDLSNIKSGMYLIKTVYTDKIELMKIIKK
jgi:photosystem II stability/assembly factor-like uncharacterized protein